MFVPVVGSPAGRAFTTGEPARFGRADLAGLDSDVGRLLLAEGIQSMCSVRLAVHERRLGTLSIGRLGGEPFTVFFFKQKTAYEMLSRILLVITSLMWVTLAVLVSLRSRRDAERFLRDIQTPSALTL